MQERHPINILVCSALASLSSTIVTNPIEVKKLNQQFIPVSCPEYPNKCNPSIVECLCANTSLRYKLFSGLSISIPMVLFSNMIFMQLYEFQKRMFISTNFMKQTPASSTIVAAVSSRTIVSLITTPMEARRVRVSNRSHKKHHQLSFEQNKSSLRATLTRDILFSGIYWTLVESMRNRISGGGQYRNKHKTNFEIMVDNAIPGLIAGCTASIITNPVDIVKTRVQAHSLSYSSMLQELSKLYRNQGIRGLCLGMQMRMLKSASHSMLYLMTLQIFLHNIRIH